MTIAEWCMFAAVLLYLLTLAPIKVLGYREFNNKKPREPDFYKDPMRARVLGAHINGIETFPFFGLAILLAEFRGATQSWIDTLAIAFILLRLCYVVAYQLDRAVLRTLIWNAAFAVNAAIFFAPLYLKP